MGEASRRKAERRAERAKAQVIIDEANMDSVADNDPEEKALNQVLDCRAHRCSKCPLPALGAEKVPPHVIRDLGQLAAANRAPPCGLISGQVCYGAVEIQTIVMLAKDQRDFDRLTERVKLRAQLVGLA